MTSIRLRLSGNKHNTIVNAYVHVPTMTSQDEVKDDVISATLRKDKLILLDFFNSRVATDDRA